MCQEKYPVIVKPVESAGSDGVPWTVEAVRVVAEMVSDYCMKMTDIRTCIRMIIFNIYMYI